MLFHIYIYIYIYIIIIITSNFFTRSKSQPYSRIIILYPSVRCFLSLFKNFYCILFYTFFIYSSVIMLNHASIENLSHIFIDDIVKALLFENHAISFKTRTTLPSKKHVGELCSSAPAQNVRRVFSNGAAKTLECKRA